MTLAKATPAIPNSVGVTPDILYYSASRIPLVEVAYKISLPVKGRSCSSL